MKERDHFHRKMKNFTARFVSSSNKDSYYKFCMNNTNRQGQQRFENSCDIQKMTILDKN